MPFQSGFTALTPVAHADGTALAPGSAFSSEISLGWFRSATSTVGLSYGTLSLAQSGAVVMGRVGVGLTTPSASLSVDTTAALRLLKVTQESSTVSRPAVELVSAGSAVLDLGQWNNGDSSKWLWRAWQNVSRTESDVISEVGAPIFIAGIHSNNQLVLTSGTAALPVIAYSSESSLGWYRSGTSTMALSYGSFNLNQARLVSIRTTGTSLSSTQLNVSEAAFFIGGASGATLGLRVNGIVYLFNSSSTTIG